MKKIVFGVVLSLVFLTNIASADLTKQDIEEIRKIVKEEIQQVNIRINDLDSKLSQRIDNVESGLNGRIDDLRSLLYVILAGMFALVGFVLWDRRTVLAPAVKKMELLEEREGKLERILREFAEKEPKLATIMRNITL